MELTEPEANVLLSLMSSAKKMALSLESHRKGMGDLKPATDAAMVWLSSASGDTAKSLGRKCQAHFRKLGTDIATIDYSNSNSSSSSLEPLDTKVSKGYPSQDSAQDLDYTNLDQCKRLVGGLISEAGEEFRWSVLVKVMKDFSLGGSYKAVVDAAQDYNRLHKGKGFGYFYKMAKSYCDKLDDSVNPKCHICGSPTRPVDGEEGVFVCRAHNHKFKRGR